MRIITGVLLCAAVSNSLVGCGDAGKGIEIENYPNADNMLEVSSDNLKVIRIDDDGNRASIAFGESDTHWCDITINSDTLKAGSIGLNTLDGTSSELAAECQWDGKYFVQSAKHHTSVALNMHNGLMTTDLLLITPKDNQYLALTVIDLRLPNEKSH